MISVGQTRSKSAMSAAIRCGGAATLRSWRFLIFIRPSPPHRSCTATNVETQRFASPSTDKEILPGCRLERAAPRATDAHPRRRLMAPTASRHEPAHFASLRLAVLSALGRSRAPSPDTADLGSPRGRAARPVFQGHGCGDAPVLPRPPPTRPRLGPRWSGSIAGATPSRWPSCRGWPARWTPGGRDPGLALTASCSNGLTEAINLLIRRTSGSATASATSPTTGCGCCCTAASRGRLTGPRDCEAAQYAWRRRARSVRAPGGAERYVSEEGVSLSACTLQAGSFRTAVVVAGRPLAAGRPP